MNGYMGAYNNYTSPQPQNPNFIPNQNGNFQNSNCDFVNVPGPEQVKEFIVRPGQKVYFLDNNQPLMYTKEANNFGTTETKAFLVNEVDFAQILNKASGVSENQGVTKTEYAELVERMNKTDTVLAGIMEKLDNMTYSNNKNNNGRRNGNEPSKQSK